MRDGQGGILLAMRTQRLVVSLLVALELSLLPSPALGKGFSDVSGKTPYARAIETLQKRGVIEGYADGTFKANATINRAEFLKIVLEGAGIAVPATVNRCFPEAHGEWYARYVCTAKQMAIVDGYPDCYFRPEWPVNFVEASKILSLAFRQQPQNAGGEG